MFTLLLVPFESKLINFPTHWQCLKTSRKSMVQCLKLKSHFTNVQGLTEALIIGKCLLKRYQKKHYLIGYKSFDDVSEALIIGQFLLKRYKKKHYLIDYRSLNDVSEALIIGQFLLKRCQKKHYLIGYKSLNDVLKKTFGVTLTVGRQKFVQNIRMKYFGFIDVFSSEIKTLHQLVSQPLC